MRIWVDADACPKVIKEILYRGAIRTKTNLVLVSNHAISNPSSPYISKLQVTTGFDVADNKILALIEKNDLVITADIPLAHEVINKGAIALNPRGILYIQANIKEKLAMRTLSNDLRSMGKHTGGPATISKSDLQRFANELDRCLASRNK